MKRVAIHTLGCKVNQYESNWIMENLTNNEYIAVDFKDVADVYIINTCTVTAEADRKSRQMVRQAKKRNPKAKVIVTGCYSNLNPEKFSDFIVFRNKKKVVEFLTGNYPKQEIIRRPFDKSRFFIKVQDGCNKFCTYCRIPYARGKDLHSKSISVVLDEIDLAVENGYQEIVLTGINIGLYGKDIGIKFIDLLNNIKSKNYDVRFRISSIDPQDVHEILDFLENTDNFVHHLHLSLQSGNNRILKLMNRDYSREMFMDLLSSLRKIDPLYSVSTDIIVGFPSENDESINDTINILNFFEFSRIHIFPYSNRPETAAYKMKEQLPSYKIKNYLSMAHEIAEESKNRYKILLDGHKDYGIYEGHNNLLGQYYVDTIDLSKSKTSRYFTYKYKNNILYAV